MGTEINLLPEILATAVAESDPTILDSIGEAETKKLLISELRKVILGRLLQLGAISPTQFSTQVDNFNPTGLSTAGVLFLSAASPGHSWTGLAGGVEGRLIFAINHGSFPILLRGEHGSSTDLNRFATGPDGGDVYLHGGSGVFLIYRGSGGTGRWRHLAIAKSASATFQGLMSAADFSKLAGIEALADVTDAANVNAAGAIMHTDIPGSVLGRVIRTGSETYNVVLDNYGASTAPTINDDVSVGYGVGSFWWDLTGDRFYTCVDATDGAAVWLAVVDVALLSGGTLSPTFSSLAANTLDVEEDVQFHGEVDHNDQRIVNVGDPVNPQDATTKAYVDTSHGYRTLVTRDPPEDFIGNQTTQWSWLSSVSGTGASVNGLGTVASHPGCCQQHAGTTTTGRASMYRGMATAFRIGTDAIECELIFRVPTLSTVSEEFIVVEGWSDGITAEPTNGIYLLYDRLNHGTALMACTSAASVRTRTSTAVTLNAGDWIRLRIKLNAGATSAEFWVGVNGAAPTLVATLTTNIPAATSMWGAVSMILKSAGTTSRNIDLDYADPFFYPGFAAAR